MQRTWCWKCRGLVFLLDEQEWERVQPLLRVGLEETKARREEHATTLEDVDMATTYVRALDAFEALTGERPTDPFDHPDGAVLRCVLENEGEVGVVEDAGRVALAQGRGDGFGNLGVAALLVRDQPEQIGSTIVHGDYRLGNMLVADGRVAGVLDWELCTLGDPLADVGYLMNNWIDPGEPTAGSSGPTGVGGFPDRAAMLDRYAAATGRDVSRVPYYRAFSYWRLAAIVEGVLARYLAGAMGAEADTSLFRAQVEGLASMALQLLED